MNVLLTCVGRRNYMVDYFKEAVDQYGGKVFALNNHSDASGLWVADFPEIGPSVNDDNYSDFLLAYCVNNQIDLVISLFDVELPILSSLKYHFEKESIKVIVGDEWLTRMANDKWETHLFLQRNKFDVVATYLSIADFLSDHSVGKISFPVFVKPRWGTGSLFIYKAVNEEELAFYYKKASFEIHSSYLKHESAFDVDKCIVIQQVMSGEEYGLDIVNNLDGEYKTTIIKKKLAMRNGETDIAISVNLPALSDLGKRLSQLCKHPAIMDVDVFYDGDRAFVLDINPRFGGGYPFSHAAGANVPKAIVDWHNGITTNEKLYLTSKIGIKAMKGFAIITDRHNI